jgi:uncharacterized protein
MVEMELFRIRIDDTRSDQLVILKEKKGKRLLPIVIGAYEADAIRLKVNGAELPRPLTHDLLVNTISKLGAVLERIVVHKLFQGTFFAKIFLRKKDGSEEEVDARPSDAVALAVRTGAKIYAEEHLLDFYPLQ